MPSSKLGFIWPNGCRGEDFLEIDQSEKKNCLWRPCLLANQDEMSNRYRGSPIDVSYQVLVHLEKWFQRRGFLEINQSEGRIVCGGHVC